MIQRKAFIRYFFREVTNLRYALLKTLQDAMEELPQQSDIDMVVHHEDKAGIIDVIRKGPDIAQLHFHRKTYAVYISIYFNDGGYLKMDLIHRFDRKGILFLDPDKIIEEVYETQDGLKFAAHHHNFEYIMLFYLLNGVPVPQRYRDYFAGFTFEERAEIFTHVTSVYKVNINLLDELYETKTRFSKKIVGHVHRLPVNRGFLRMFHKARYAVDVFKDCFYHRGITVTFSGVDGAGKSTIIREVKEVLEKKYRQRTVVLRHRPSLLPILSSLVKGRREAERQSRERLPRQGTNRNFASSLLRFFYYYTDYLIGQYYVYFRYTLRGYTVLYDRYYFDFIIDARRSNIVLPRRFLRWCYSFIFKPQVNVFLFAPVEVIRERKNELSAMDIKTLSTEYHSLFSDLGRRKSTAKYLIINNTNIEHTISQVTQQCIRRAG